jgi:hypothetical protein
LIKIFDKIRKRLVWDNVEYIENISKLCNW